MRSEFSRQIKVSVNNYDVVALVLVILFRDLISDVSFCVRESAKLRYASCNVYDVSAISFRNFAFVRCDFHRLTIFQIEVRVKFSIVSFFHRIRSIDRSLVFSFVRSIYLFLVEITVFFHIDLSHPYRSFKHRDL